MNSVAPSSLLMGILICTCFQACAPPPPEEALIREKIIGSYCANGENDYRLILTDSAYYSIRRSPGVLQTQTKVRESCKGRYRLVYEGKQWLITFESDPDPDAVLENCEQSYTIWNASDGFVVGEEAVTLKELFDQVSVTKAACDRL